MKRSLVPMLFVAACCAADAADNKSSPASTDKAGSAPVRATIAPGKIHEECRRLEAGDARRYRWKSDSTVDFNIHFHKGPEVYYPVKRDGIRGDAGSFTAKTGEDYCWMWTARDKPVKLEGHIESK